MSKLIGKPRDRNILDELIENTREANAEFLKEIERERLEEERILKEINKEILEADTKAGENEEKRKKRQKDGFAEIQKRLNELTDPNYKPIIPKVDVFPPKAKPAPKEKLGKRIHKYLLEDPSTAKTFGKVMLYITLPALTAMLGTIRGCAEISERTDYGAECVTARRYVGIFGKQLEFGSLQQRQKEDYQE